MRGGCLNDEGFAVKSKGSSQKTKKPFDISFSVPEKPRKSNGYVSTYMGVDRGVHDEIKGPSVASQNDLSK